MFKELARWLAEIYAHNAIQPRASPLSVPALRGEAYAG